MKLWVLTIFMIHGKTIYGYKFLKKENCHRIGKELTSIFKKSTYTCKEKEFPIDTKDK